MCANDSGTHSNVKPAPRVVTFRRRLIVIVLVLAGLPLAAQEAAAALCGDRNKLLNALRKSYGERPKFRALTLDGNIVEVLVSKRRSWTVIVTSPNGVSCLVSAGQFWERSAAAPHGPGI